MEPEILYEDEEVLAINKPSGWVVNRAASVRGETVQDWVERQRVLPRVLPPASARKAARVSGSLPPVSPAADFVRRSGIVHRIDKETSGVLLVAKTPGAFKELQRQFKDREVEKMYVALVHGRVVPPEGEIRAPVGRLPWSRERFGVLAGGREAETRYKGIKLIELIKLNKQSLAALRWLKDTDRWYSLVEFYPKTGRTHQIRVHAKSIGHPVVADTFYAGRKTARRDRAWCPRLFLHASRIVFKHPRTGKRITVEAKLPTELAEALDALEALER